MRYQAETIVALAAELSRYDARERWTIFDNTGAGAALENALEMLVELPAMKLATSP